MIGFGHFKVIGSSQFSLTLHVELSEHHPHCHGFGVTKQELQSFLLYSHLYISTEIKITNTHNIYYQNVCSGTVGIIFVSSNTEYKMPTYRKIHVAAV